MQKRIAAKWGKEQGDFCCFDEDSQLTVLLDTLNLCFWMWMLLHSLGTAISRKYVMLCVEMSA